ncbi:MAG: hypothetical protein ACYC6M_01605 [Terriglobales bacterium]
MKRELHSPGTCHHCGRPLNVNETPAPQFGLAVVRCAGCRYQHLFSPAELSVARQFLIAHAPTASGAA